MARWRNDSGVALAEFALVLPILLLIILGSIELSRYALLHLKLDKSATTMADLVTQRSSVSLLDLADIGSNAGQIMKPFGFNGSIIFSSVYFIQTPIAPCAGANSSCIAWQYQAAGSDASRIGASGGNALLPGGYTVVPGQNVITAEVYTSYSPIIPFTGDLISALAPHTIYKVAVLKPRQGTLFNPPG